MIIRQLAVGPLQANCFIVGCEKTKQAVVIDPGGEADKILMTLANHKLTLTAILNTHGHFDHVEGNKGLKDATGCDIYIHEEDAPMLQMVSSLASSFGLQMKNSPPADKFLKEGDVISVGEESLKVVHTPGHSPGGVSFCADGVVFVGDTLFAGSIGRTDLPGGSYNQLIASVKDKIFPLGDECVVCAGHGPETTVGREKMYNPFFQ
ncbi:Glyoxylase, beta-lactamase superfamily II [Desulfatibacillum alkenivorans DSM 16219]|uniref:Glyoxylase, beta-lactamase superfamily II n=1 Tax=Desulfatibacillum alkenivorans DSM 16219 TaxID=1121393 RepID=A0A1M6Z6D3_9BACT|nr:MBL fold metallo-hydrolase [Desulfatibacillum alkenivorans]SHL25987.1 Glyoxylase, beta-lactamase superfamily II [Desulfatibacillum alkenivorans DSM 16219]